jgi:hypothetical protein
MANLMKVTTLIMVVIGSVSVSGCSRLVSTEPLLADRPTSSASWEGAYVGELGEKAGRLEMLLQLKKVADGNFAMTIHTRGIGKSLLAGKGPLSLIGVGETRIVDLGDNYAVAQTRCEVASPPSARWSRVADKWKTVLDAAKTLDEIDEDDDEAPAPSPPFLGPYVYPLILAQGDNVLTLLGTTETDVEEAVGEADIGIRETGNIAGDSGILIAGNAILEEDDLHIRPGSDSEALLGFFKRLAQKELGEPGDETPGNAVRWHKLSPQKLRSLELSDQFPAEGWTRMWCNLSAATAS